MPPPNPEALRAGLAQFIKSRGLTVSGWCKRAGVTEGTLRSFLAGRSQTLTHATLAALAYAAEEPITALVRGNSVWGETEAIEVKFQVAATELEGNAHCLPDDQTFHLRLPTSAIAASKIGAIIRDDSANEKWPQGSILVCTDFEWLNEIDEIISDDFWLLLEQRTEFREDGEKIYSRCTVRQLISEDGVDYFLLKSRNPKFRDAIRIPRSIVGTTVEAPIVIGLGSRITLLGRVLAAYTLERWAVEKKCLLTRRIA